VAAEDPGYLRFLQKSDLEKPFSAEVRRLAREAAAGRFPVRPTIPAGSDPAEPAPGEMAPPVAPEKGQGSLFS